jgi:hypothetical protein
MRHKTNNNQMKCPERKEGSIQTNVVTQIRQYHGQVVSADKSIADIGKAQIRAAYKCGQLLAQERARCQPNGWGRWCKKNLPDMSKSTIGRYILLTEVSDLTHLERNYRTLNAAYVGEEITSAPRQRITIETIKGSSANTGHGQGLKHHNGDGNDGINLKAKVKGGGNLGDLMSKVSPSARAEIESQFEKSPVNGGKVQKATFRTPAPGTYVEFGTGANKRSTPDHRKIDPSELGGEEIAGLFQRPLLIDALLLQLKRCAESKDADEIRACASNLKPIVKWYEKYAAKVGVALAA